MVSTSLCKQVFSTKPASSTTSNKIKTIIHKLIVSYICRIIRAISRAKQVLVKNVRELQIPVHFIYQHKTAKQKQRNRIYFGSFRLHYNWGSSSHVFDNLYYDSSWNSVTNYAFEGYEGSEFCDLSGHVEEKVLNDGRINNCNEIDCLADKFIARCHKKFRLEKQESYRRFQEMLARSI